ncbi:MAG: dUTP diphosphatase [Halopseudomonas aestusnigri]
MNSLSIPVVQLSHGEGLPLPSYATPQSAGMDLLAAIDDTITLAPGERILVPTALTIALPTGYEAQVRPRSGLALKNGITLANTPGTIDADYRGEIGVIMINLGKDTFTIERGARIAQMVIAPCIQAGWMPIPSLDATARGDGGFGSTGVSSEE